MLILIKNFKKKIVNFFSVAVLFLFVFLFSVSSALAGLPGYLIGGRITLIQPCNTGLVYTVAGPSPGLFMSLYLGTSRYASYIPTLGGLILGKAISPIPIPCVLGIIPYGLGTPILFHGSSIK